MSGPKKPNNIVRYDDADFFYIRKPHDIASVRGLRFSLYELLEEYLQTHNDDLTTLLRQNREIFGEKDERGLCNRLDIPTAGLLYFAKDANARKDYRDLQKQNSLIKYYTGTVVGGLFVEKIIAKNIAHHPHLDDRMIVSGTKKVTHRGKRQKGRTHIMPLEYDSVSNRTHILISIMGGVRHQIRIHCASVGNPLVGEKLYGTSRNRQSNSHLQLFSIGHSKIRS